MEEKKEKKKLNKKPLLICFAIALVFALIGFIDIKTNAAESNNINFTLEVWRDDENVDLVLELDEEHTISGSDDIEVYYCQSHSVPVNNSDTYAQAFVVSKYPITHTNPRGTFNGKEYKINGQTFYVRKISLFYTNTNGKGISGFVKCNFVYDNVKELESVWLDTDEFAQLYAENNLDVKVDYNSFEVDDDLPVPSNIKRNIIKNEIKDNLIPNTLGGETYDYITWTNTSETHPLQLQVVPVVQYFDVRPFENIFTKEFYGEWNTQAIYEEVTNSFTLCTFTTNPDTLLKYPLFTSGLSFKSECNDKYSKGFFEENYLKFGYRIRYVDIENEKAGPWLVLVPTKELDDYKTFVEYADTSISDSSDGNGLFNEYENLDDIENAKTDIKTENDFKDKYDVIDGDVDVQEATNWLYSVVNFIKGTPQVVGSVLGFLPQPILYGMYVCIFLGIIASGIAIVKALL